MAQSGVDGGWHLKLASLFVLGSLALCGNSASAQMSITPDGTLGAERSVVTPINPQDDRIDGGAIRGTNLFHSFSEFNINEGRGAYFANPAGIQNIFSRVTGNNPSRLFGTLGVLGNANLFFLNPNGILFGPNTSLDLRGSFVASTASSLLFSNGSRFSATNPETPSLLTIDVPVPIGLQYEGVSRAIGMQDSILEVQPDKTLALVGGEVSLQGGTLQSLGGRVELGGVAGAGLVGLDISGNELSLSFSADLARTDVSLTNGVVVNVRSAGGGSIAINAQNLYLAGGSKLRAGIAEGSDSFDAKAGDIVVDATGAITLTDAGSFISNAVRDERGQGGDVYITAGALRVTNGAQIFTGTLGQGNAGNVNINVRNTAVFDGVGSDGTSSNATSQVAKEATGQGGNVNLTAGALRVTNGARLESSTEGQGNAGNVNINVRNIAAFDGVGSDESSSGAYSRAS